MAKKITIENLALMIQRGFDETAQKTDVEIRFGQVDKRLEKIEGEMRDGFLNINARLSNIEQDMAEIQKHFVYRYEFEDLMARVKYVENKLKIKSGK